MSALFDWWTDATGHPWVRHTCGGEQDDWRLPPPWRLDGVGGITPSLHCVRCGAHEILTAADQDQSLWNRSIPVDMVCGSCDGWPAPKPECEWCDGTGVDKELAARGQGDVASANPVNLAPNDDPAQLDPGVWEQVRVLRAGGVETFESCEGGQGHAFPVPSVRFFGDKAEGLRALALALRAGLRVDELRRVWPVVDGEPTGPWWEMTFLLVPTCTTIRTGETPWAGPVDAPHVFDVAVGAVDEPVPACFEAVTP